MMERFKYYLNEIAKDSLSKIGAEINQVSRNELSDRAFNNIFGDKMRIVIPLNYDATQDQLENTFKKLKIQANLKTGVVQVPVQTQQGTKIRQQRIGSFLQDLSKKDHENSEYYLKLLKWYEKNKPKLNREDNKIGVSIIISRHPIDIVRMSDHKEIDSCHSPGRSHFQCAIQEARTGGAVAFVVKNQDLMKIKNLQAKDIFKDRDRNIDGIEPLERLRLRRFDKGDLSLLIPEKKTYGISHVGLQSAVDNWARQIQSDKINFNNPPDFKEFVLRGGSYQDTRTTSDLWNKFFNTNIASSLKTSIDQKNEKEKADENIKYRANAMIAQHPYNHYGVNYGVNYEYNRDLLWWSASGSFSFYADQFIQIPDEDDFKLYGGKTLKSRIVDGTNLHGIEEFRIDMQSGIVKISFDINDSELDGTIDGLESFLDEIDRIDEKYDQHRNIVKNILIQEGFLKDDKEIFRNFNHFQIEEQGSKKELWHDIISDKIWIGDLKGVLTENVNLMEHDGTVYFNKHNAIEINVLSIFPKFLRGINRSARFTWNYGLKNNKTNNSITIEDPIKIFLHLEFSVPEGDAEIKKYYAGIKYMDDNWQAFEQRAAQFWKSVKPLLMPQGNGSYIGKTPLPKPIKPKPDPNQMKLPFGECSFIKFLNLNI